MKQIADLLRDADPLRDEQALSPQQREMLRQAMLAAVLETQAPARTGSRRRVLVLAVVSLTLIAAVLVRPRGEVQAALRFEVRLAEDKPSEGLKEVGLPGLGRASGRAIYLHKEVIVTNSDIQVARVMEGNSPSQYWIAVEFNPAGARKMRAATRNHIGRPIAILLNGQVTAVPVLRTPVDSSARITGNFSQEEAQKIVDGMRIR